MFFFQKIFNFFFWKNYFKKTIFNFYKIYLIFQKLILFDFFQIYLKIQTIFLSLNFLKILLNFNFLKFLTNLISLKLTKIGKNFQRKIKRKFGPGHHLFYLIYIKTHIIYKAVINIFSSKILPYKIFKKFKTQT